jgi:hypothetical protein
MTKAEMRDEVHRMLNDTSGTLIPADEVDDLLQEAQELMAEHGAPVIRRSGVPLQSYRTFYRLSEFAPDAIQPVRLYSTRLLAPLEPISMEELDVRAVNWIATVGPPTAWFPRGWDQFGIYPKPSGDEGLLWIDYLAWPQVMLVEWSVSEFDEEDHETLVAYGWYDGILRSNQLDEIKEAWQSFAGLLKSGYTRRGVLTADRGRRFEAGRNGSRQW